jgi:hypothetical protein
MAIVIALGIACDGGDSEGGECETELPYPLCGDGRDTIGQGGEDALLGATESDGTVASVEPSGDAFVLRLDGTEPDSFILPAEPPVTVGDVVHVVPEDRGFRLEQTDGTVFGYVGVRPYDTSAWATNGETHRAELVAGGVSFGVTPRCAYWAEFDGCGVFVPAEGVVAYGFDLDGVELGGLPQTFERPDGRTLTVLANGATAGLWGYFEECEPTCLLPRSYGFDLSFVLTDP